jgi:hypothetical protein
LPSPSHRAHGQALPRRSKTVNAHPQSSRFTTVGGHAPRFPTDLPTASRARAGQPDTPLEPAAPDMVESPIRRERPVYWARRWRTGRHLRRQRPVHRLRRQRGRAGARDLRNCSSRGSLRWDSWDGGAWAATSSAYQPPAIGETLISA